MTDIFRLCGIAIIGAVAIILCKSMKSDMTVPISITASVIILYYTVNLIAPLVKFADETLASTEFSVYMGTALKALGICLLTQFCSEFCKDCGAPALSGKIEFAGKALILTLGLPIIKGLITLARDIIK